MKRAFLIVSAFVAAACVAPVAATHGGVAVAATPTPAALQYDEITRMILPPATPPAPGAFQADYQALTATASNGEQTPAPHGLGSMIGNMMGGHNPMEMMQRMSQGNLTRYTYYKGWIRTDDPIAQTAVIEKCAQHQYIHLDLAKKTYTVDNAKPPCPTQPMPYRGEAGGQPAQAEPGTADMTFTGTSNDLGPLSIDGIATTGYDQSMQMKTTNATGSCRDGEFSMGVTKYISQVHVPRPYCPLPRTMTTGGMMTRASGGGCEPRMHVNGTMSGMNEGDRLVMYMRMAMGQSEGQGGGMNMLVERGNVKWFSGGPADALFAIPPGFTQAQ